MFGLFRRVTAICLIGFAALSVSISEPMAQQVKMSSSGICHDRSSPWYDRTKNFEAYPTLNACLRAGGRLPKKSGGTRTAEPPRPSPNTTIVTSSGAPRYDRDQFGSGWGNLDADCKNTRHDILESLSTSTIETGSSSCVVARGRWLDPYTGRTFYNARDLDIDHLVPLKWAWDRGAWRWSSSKRERFANDPANLFAVQASVNREKGAQGPLEWMPPDRSFHCQYVTRFERVARTYQVQFRPGELAEIQSLRRRVC